MEVQIILMREDVEAANKYLKTVAPERSNFLRELKRSWVAFLLMFLLLIAALTKARIDPIHAIVGTVIGLLLGLGIMLRSKSILVKGVGTTIEQSLRETFRHGPWTVSISRDGFTIVGKTFRSVHQWDHYSEVVQTDDHVFLLSRKTEFHVIPRRCFENDRSFVAFAEQCKKHFDAAARYSPTNPSTGIQGAPPTGSKSSSHEITNVPPTT